MGEAVIEAVSTQDHIQHHLIAGFQTESRKRNGKLHRHTLLTVSRKSFTGRSGT